MQNEPVILGIETSTDACSAAVLRGGQVLASRLHAAGSEHARELPLMVEELLAETKDFPIEAVAVSEGPGSYTGLRIGASVAKGLAYGLNVPLMAVPTLQIMAAQVASQVRDGLLCPMIDARRMEVYNAFYTPELKEVIPVAATIVDEHSFAEQLAAGKVYFFGNGAAKCKSVIRHENAVFLPSDDHSVSIGDIVPNAAWIRGGKIVDTAYWEPFYLKAYEAKKATNIIK